MRPRHCAYINSVVAGACLGVGIFCLSQESYILAFVNFVSFFSNVFMVYSNEKDEVKL